MRFTNLLSNLIVEQSRFQVLYDKLVKPSPKAKPEPGKKAKGIMDFNTLKEIIFADPTTKAPQGTEIESLSVEDMDNVKVGKYTQWLLKNFVSPKLGADPDVDPNSPQYKSALAEFQRLFMEDLYKVTGDLQKFERFKNRLPQEFRDINKLTPETLYDQVKDFSLEKTKATKEEKKEASKTYEHPGAEIVFRGSNWTVARISDQGQLGKDAAQFYGGSYQEPSRGETRWCTSSPGLSYFNGYIKDGPLYVVIPNSGRKFSGEKEFGDVSGLPALRYQFHFPSNQYMDPQDRQINLVDFLNGQEEGLKEFFKPEFAKGLVNKGGKKVEINYPDSSAGKFVALYGFDELFESLPEDIEHLLINNKSKEDIALNVPESLGRFKSLQALLFQNIIKTLPNSIGELQNLNFLALPSNKDLQAVPESVAEIPGLAFINLKDSNPNVKIPPRLKEKLSDEGGGFYYVN
jgi:Leucine-rich repeat (LRR) protein